MDAEVKARWIAALRSGDYTQGRGKLGREGANGQREYCCLGVLCDVERERLTAVAGAAVEWEDGVLWSGSSMSFPEYAACHALGMSPDFWQGIVVKTMFGIERLSLASLNDNGFTFDQIADIIDWWF